MMTTVKALLLITIVLVTSLPAHAQCAFDTGTISSYTRIFSSSMVRAFGSCPDSFALPVTNTQTRGSTPACAHVFPDLQGATSSPYRYGTSSSGCRLRLSAVKTTNCASYSSSWIDGDALGLLPQPCQIMRIRVDCKGILVGSTAAPITAPDHLGFHLSLVLRQSLDDPVNDDLTAIDFPVSVIIPILSPGRLRLDTSLQELLVAAVDSVEATIPPCASIQIVDAVIKDPDSIPFAVIGLSTR